MTTEQRLERLERENRWMRRIGVVAVAVAAAVFLVGQGKEKELPDLEVRSLTMRDKDGRIRAKLWAIEHPALGSAGLTLVDRNGNVRGAFDTYNNDGHPSLHLSDPRMETRAILHLAADGAPALSLHDRDGKPRALLVTRADGSPALTLADKDSQARAVLGVTETVNKAGAKTKTAENTLTLRDAKGNVIWQAPR